MTYLQLHQHNYNLTNVLNKQFATQVKVISPKAHLCYHGHNQKFTVSLFELNEAIDTEPQLNIVSKQVETEHVMLISEYVIDSKVEQLILDITKFVINEGPVDVI